MLFKHCLIGVRHFVPYGIMHQDQVETTGDDVSFDLPLLEIGVTLFNKLRIHEEIHVSPSDSCEFWNVAYHFIYVQISSNGLISFGLPFTNFLNQEFSASFSLFQDAIIAPLWIDLILEGQARLYYRTSQSLSDLDVVATLISNTTQDDSYRPLFAVIVTWENVPMFRNRGAIVS